jgi:DNA-binding winged helix-turn-helix (wHTH) protein
MVTTAQSLLAKKMALESLWNNKFMEEGRVTNEMQAISRQIKDVVRELIARSEFEAAAGTSTDYEIHAFAG